MIVFADLPLLSTRDLENILSILRYCDVVVCPDLRLEGTNIMGFRKNLVSRPQYGVGSFEKHLSMFGGKKVKTYLSLGTGFDLDTEEDLEYLRRRNITY